nr:hypothetical protein [Tanacetum cinerariifolium]
MFFKYSTGQIPPKKSRGKDVALELRKSSSLTKAEEEAAKQFHATHARILTKFVPEYAKKKTSSRSSRSVVIHTGTKTDIGHSKNV